MCLAAKAINTRKSYKYAFDTWTKWCVSHSLQSLPASDFHVALYFVHLSETAKSSSKINEVFYAISWIHKLSGCADPCKSDLVMAAKEGALRTIGHSVSKKEPITIDMLKSIVYLYGHEKSNLKDVRTACMCLSFSVFLRFAELSNIKRDNITFYDDYVKIVIEQSKTDVYREGKDVIISCTGTMTCPVNMLKRYLALAHIPSNGTDYIFRGLLFCKSTNTYKLRNSGQLSYSSAREILLNTIDHIGLDKTQFGLHSLRSGGATAAAAAQVEDIIFKKHGRWKSEKAKDGYVKENLSQRLSVTQKLGI